ncbi:hypothetical protein B0H10DRAFT_2093647 [Mycena sp. CBHHK59/15]|nr:hypothetical protein B0H10DRAFT_2093647 [Mycena sp. CBHHK59/15]
MDRWEFLPAPEYKYPKQIKDAPWQSYNVRAVWRIRWTVPVFDEERRVTTAGVVKLLAKFLFHSAFFLILLSQKCDGARPCNQCRLRPPRSGAPCQFPNADGYHDHSVPAQMLETIQVMKSRIEELESLTGQDTTRVILNQPYNSQFLQSPESSGGYGSSGSLTPEPISVSSPFHMEEPPSNLIAQLVDTFLARFTHSGYFCMDPVRFRHAALLNLPFGDPNRPSPALLSAVYLWGCVLSQMKPPDPYTEYGFLMCVLQNIPHDLNCVGTHSQLIFDVIQAEVLLSYYYLHTSCPLQGRYHSAAAASLALGANLHLTGNPQQQTYSYPSFPLVTTILPPAVDAVVERQRVNIFWAVVILNNYWVTAQGVPSAIPYDIPIDTPWPFSSQGGATMSNFLIGDDLEGFSSVALLAKASVLLERIITFSSRSIDSPDPAALSSLDQRLHSFQSSLPPLPGGTRGQTLLVTHALTDIAIVRLHSPHAQSTETSRFKCLAAGGRIVASLAARNLVDDAQECDPILGPLVATLCNMYMSQITSVSVQPGGEAQAQHHELQTSLRTLMNALASLAAFSPVAENCFMAVRHAYTSFSSPG